MRKFVLLCASIFGMVLLFSAGPARAQFVLFVGPSGSDTNGCTPSAPCATFQGAINKFPVANSQINCLGTGNYGPITITFSLTIDCGSGNVGNIVSSSVNGITINTTAAATIILRHLALNGLSTSTGVSGINATSFFSGTLIVEDCMINGYHDGSGITFEPQSGRGLLQVSNSQFIDNVTGLLASPASGQIASVTLNKVELVGNSFEGLLLTGPGIIAGTMRDSVVGENGESGVLAVASQVFFTIEESSIVDNLLNGIQSASAGSSVKVGASTIGGNGTGVKATVGGSVVSFGDNHISDNGSDGNFTSTKALQ